MRTRSKAVALSISLAVAAGGAGAASTAAQPSPTTKDVAPELVEETGPGSGDSQWARGEASKPAAADQKT